MAAIRRGLCTKQEAANCLDEYGETGIEWACANCPKKKFSDLRDYTKKLFNLFALQRGGYPFEANDLTLEEWADLGRLRETLQPKTTCPLTGNK